MPLLLNAPQCDKEHLVRPERPVAHGSMCNDWTRRFFSRLLLDEIAELHPVVHALRLRRERFSGSRRLGLQGKKCVISPRADGHRDGSINSVDPATQPKIRPDAVREHAVRGAHGPISKCGDGYNDACPPEQSCWKYGRRVVVFGLHRPRHAADRRREEAPVRHKRLCPGRDVAVHGHREPLPLFTEVVWGAAGRPGARATMI